MHELSIAMSIVDMGCEEAVARDIRIRAIHLRLGPLSGVVKDALLACYPLACEGTALEGSRLVVVEVPIVAYCTLCREDRNIASIQWICCPVCGTPTPQVLSGRELEVTALEVLS